MDKYKAVSNNMDNIKSEKEQKQEATEKAVDVIGETALDAYTGGTFSKAKNMASNIPVFGKRADKTWNKAVKRVAKPLAKTPVGDLAKKANDSGITDKARQAKNVMNTVNNSNAQNQAPKMEGNINTNNSNQNNKNISSLFGGSNKKITGSSNFLDKGDLWGSLPKSLKLKIIISCSVAFLIMMIVFCVFANDDIHNLELTNGENIKSLSSGNTADLAASLQKVGQFYIDNVGVYSRGRDYAQIDFIGSSFRKDCTGFAIAYMSYVAGKVLPDSYTLDMIDPNGKWAKTVGEAGWKVYTSDEIGSLENLQTGDVLIADNRYGYSTKGQHAEIYIDSKHTFGWGSAKKTYPTDNAITVSNSGGHVHIMDGGHDYITVYRYMNATSGSNGTVTDLGAKKINHEVFNHGTKPKENQKYIMLHDTEIDASPENIVSSWANSGSGTAAHFVVGRDGTIVQAVELDVITHHAGFGGPGNFDSKYGVGSNNRQGTGDDLKGQVTKGYEGYTSYGMNSYSIGIEMVHVGGQDYPEAQLNAVDKVIAYIDTYYGKQSTIIDHKDWRPSNSDTDSKFATYLDNYKSTRHH